MRASVILLALAATACIPGNRPDPVDPPPRVLDRPRAEVPRPGAAIRPVELPASETPVTPPQVAKARPAWTAKPVEADAILVESGTYVVKPGDTLRAISDRTGSSSEGIARENGLTAPFMIRAGQRLRIPGGRFHQVKAGETGIAIARAYGVEWSRMIALNALEEPYTLRTGQRLALPTASEVRGMTLEERAAAFTLDIDDLITGSEPAAPKNVRPSPPVRTAAKPVPATKAVQAPVRSPGRFAWPLTGPILTRFGPYGRGRINEGINIAVPAGTPIRASADGVVAYVGSEIALFGGLILLKHGGGWITTYAHAQELLVTRGQEVKRGQVIARAGETGSAREPQLHFEIRQGRKPVNPLDQLPKRG